MAVNSADDDRLVHVGERDISSKPIKGLFIQHVARHLTSLVLRVDAILSFFDFGASELFEVIIRIDFPLLSSNILLPNVVECSVMHRVIIILVPHTLEKLFRDVILVLLVKLIELCIDLLIVRRLSILICFPNPLDLLGEVSLLHFVFALTVVSEFPQ